ncbi:MAG: ATP-dependent helicase, partial [Thermodesulfovibrionales bacterium]
EGHRNIMAVGDDAQSIYGFRGASHETIMNFPARFAECRVIKLEENYRSSQAVLDVANAVLDNMQNKYSKCLQSARHLAGERPQVVFFKDAYEEAEWVAQMIKGQLDEGIPLHHQSVLFRSMHLSIPLQSELSRRNIPYETYGGMKFYETAHVKDLMAHLKVVSNPRDELSWNRVLMLIERIGPKTAHLLTDQFRRYHSLAEMLAQGFSQYVRGRVYSERIVRLQEALRSVLPEDVNVGEKFAVLLDYYVPIMKEKYDDWHIRLNDLEAIRQIAMRYSSLEELLEDFTLEPPERGVARIEAETKEEDRPLVLSTIHSSKGLEWDTVFIMGIVEGVLPITFALDSDEEIEEEQRLFYVAITRARNRLFLTLHHEGMRGGIYQFNRVSRFIEAPNVRANLDLGERTDSGQIISLEDSEGDISPQCDRGSLVERLSRFYR